MTAELAPCPRCGHNDPADPSRTPDGDHLVIVQGPHDSKATPDPDTNTVRFQVSQATGVLRCSLLHSLSPALLATHLEQAPVVTTTDDALDLEFAYTTWEDSCRDLYSPSMCCRRPAGHDGEHAAGFSIGRRRWT